MEKTETQAIAVLTATSFRNASFIGEAPLSGSCVNVQWVTTSGRSVEPSYFAGCGGLRTIVASKSGNDASPTIRSNPFMRNLSLSTGSM